LLGGRHLIGVSSRSSVQRRSVRSVGRIACQPLPRPSRLRQPISQRTRLLSKNASPHSNQSAAEDTPLPGAHGWCLCLWRRDGRSQRCSGPYLTSDYESLARWFHAEASSLPSLLVGPSHCSATLTTLIRRHASAPLHLALLEALVWSVPSRLACACHSSLGRFVRFPPTLSLGPNPCYAGLV